MSLEIKRGPKESPQKLLRRFSSRVQRSGILKRARRIRFRQRPLSKTAKKKAALRREKIKQQQERLRKLGKA